MNQKVNKALVFLNGDENDLSYAKKHIGSQTLLIGCDGGTDKIFDLGLKPNVVIGDFDSIKNLPTKIKNLSSDKYGKRITINDITYIKYPGDKDFLDAELALDFVKNTGLNEVILVNTNGDEIDHVLGTMIVLARRRYRNMNICAISSKHKMYIIQGRVTLNGRKGDKMSLIPLFGPVIVKSSSGLKYDPSKYRMSLQNNVGISNEFTNKKAIIDISKGRFLVVQHY